MPNIASAKKALRQSKRRRERNLKKMEVYKRAIKEYKKFAAAKQTAEAKTALRKVYKALDKAAKTNVIARNKANRLKSRLAKIFQK